MKKKNNKPSLKKNICSNQNLFESPPSPPESICLCLCCFFFIFLNLKYKMETNELWIFVSKSKIKYGDKCNLTHTHPFVSKIDLNINLTYIYDPPKQLSICQEMETEESWITKIKKYIISYENILLQTDNQGALQYRPYPIFIRT